MRCCAWASALSKPAPSRRCRNGATRGRGSSALTPIAGVINRLGFNSQGAEAVLRRLAARANAGGIVGINIGANKDAADRVADYVRLIERFAPVASYVTINISSPNTPGLRNLQQAGALDDLLARVIDARERVTRQAGPTPVLLKIAPDLSLAELDDAVGIARTRRVDGMIVGNTTLTRPASLREMKIAKEAGGLSGRPLLPLATRMLAETYVRVEGAFRVDRCRRHRFRRRRARQNPCRRQPHSALFRAHLPRPRPRCRNQDRRFSPRWSATASTASANLSAPMPRRSPPSRGRQ